MKRYKTKSADFRVFEDMAECLDIKPSAKNKHLRDSTDPHDWESKSWYGLAGGRDGFLKAYQEGWQEGAARLESMTASLPSIDTTSVKRQRVYGPAGSSVDMRKVYSGGINTAWTSRKRQRKAGKRRVSIVFHASATFEVKASVIFSRGAAAIKIAQAYQEAGYAVSVHAFCPARGVEESNSNRKHYYFFPVIKMGEIQSRAKMAAACLAGVQRVFGFWSREATESKISSGYGSTIPVTNLSDNLLPSALPIDRDNLIYIPPTIKTVEQAESFIKAL